MQYSLLVNFQDMMVFLRVGDFKDVWKDEVLENGLEWLLGAVNQVSKRRCAPPKGCESVIRRDVGLTVAQRLGFEYGVVGNM